MWVGVRVQACVWHLSAVAVWHLVAVWHRMASIPWWPHGIYPRWSRGIYPELWARQVGARTAAQLAMQTEQMTQVKLDVEQFSATMDAAKKVPSQKHGKQKTVMSTG